VTLDDQDERGRRTAAAMHDTAEQLEVAEAILHRSAEESPNEAVTARLHALGDQVTAQAHDIDRRADRLTGRRAEKEPVEEPPGSAAAHRLAGPG
jgi:hypothetical protein